MKLHPITESEWEALSLGLPDATLRPEELAAVRRVAAKVAAGHEFVGDGERDKES